MSPPPSESLTDAVGSPIPSGGPDPLAVRGVDTRGLGLRRFSARGVLVNAGFDVGLAGLGLVRGAVLAVLLDRAAFGVWGILLVSLGVLARLKLIGIADRYVQQTEADQELAFQRAFTLELASALAMVLVLWLAVPVVALLYADPRVLAPGFVLATMLIAYAFQSPQWIHYRRMDFLTQRLQTAVEPVVGLLVAVGLALAGCGYWAFVLGALAGAWAGALVAIRMSPYPLRWRLDRGTVSLYWAFSGPIVLATGASILLANGVMVAVDASLGVAAVGAVTLADSVTAFTNKVDDTVAASIYPGICAVADRVDLLRETFVKTNRLAMLWAIPFGAGLALFAPELIRWVLGERWRPATALLEIYGVVAALSHVGFNWDDYYRARAETRPIAVFTLIGSAATLLAGVPLLLLDGLGGLAWGIGLGSAVALIVRARYVRALFGIGLFVHGLRAVAPVLPAVGVILALRALGVHPSTPLAALGQLILFVGLAGGVAAWAERRLLLEMLAYLRRPR